MVVYLIHNQARLLGRGQFAEGVALQRVRFTTGAQPAAHLQIAQEQDSCRDSRTCRTATHTVKWA